MGAGTRTAGHLGPLHVGCWLGHHRGDVATGRRCMVVGNDLVGAALGELQVRLNRVRARAARRRRSFPVLRQASHACGSAGWPCHTTTRHLPDHLPECAGCRAVRPPRPSHRTERGCAPRSIAQPAGEPGLGEDGRGSWQQPSSGRTAIEAADPRCVVRRRRERRRHASSPRFPSPRAYGCAGARVRHRAALTRLIAKGTDGRRPGPGGDLPSASDVTGETHGRC
jgi:hypothetical protein